MLEASPSPVYGAALLMRFGSYSPSRVQIPPPPLHLEAPVPRTGASAFPGFPRPRLRVPTRPLGVFAGHKGCGERISHDGGSHVMFFLSPGTGRKGRERRRNKRTSTRSLTDRASDYGSEGCRFESCRVHTDERPRITPGPLAFQGRTAAKCSNRVSRRRPWHPTACRARPAPLPRWLRRRPPSSWRSGSAAGSAGRSSDGS